MIPKWIITFIKKMLPLGLILPHTCSPMGVWLCWLCGNLGRENCPRDWEWRPEFQKCYYIIPEKLTWDDANAKCGNLSANATLTSIGSEKENTYIGSLVHIIDGLPDDEHSIDGHAYPWIGGRNTLQGWALHFNWADRSPFLYNRWFGTEPDGDGTCMYVDVAEHDYGGPAFGGQLDHRSSIEKMTRKPMGIKSKCRQIET